MGMKIISQNLSKELEFLRALAKLYENNHSSRERDATIEAIAALERLLGIINSPNNDSPNSLPIAA
jgi:hypothetical protein